MRDWRNRQTRTFKGRVGDRVSSSLTSRTKRTNSLLVLFYFPISHLLTRTDLQNTPLALRGVRKQVCSAERQTRTFKGQGETREF